MRAPSALLLCCLLVVSSLLVSHVDCAKKAATPAPATPDATIEEVSAKQLERLLEDKDYVAVYWCKCLYGVCSSSSFSLDNPSDVVNETVVHVFCVKNSEKCHKRKNFKTLSPCREVANGEWQKQIVFQSDMQNVQWKNDRSIKLSPF